MTPINQRIVVTAADIEFTDPPLIEYQHGLFCQIALPRSRPKGREFIREYQNGAILIQAGNLWDGQHMAQQPVPYGPKARLSMLYINGEAVRRRNPEVYCERSGRKFMDRLGLNTDGGRDYNLFKTQMKAWAACRMTLGFNHLGAPTTIDTKPVTLFRGWYGEQADGSPAVWPGLVTLGREYFEDLLKHAVPLDPRALRALAHSAMALDAYSFLARRLHSLEKPIQVTKEQFKAQFGQEYQGKYGLYNFWNEWVAAVRAALAVYPSAKVELLPDGMMLYPSPPPVHYESVAVSHGLADKVRATLPTPPEARNLKTETLEQFRTLYPSLDPYACKAAFDAWLEGKRPDQQPKAYDRAFLGFAKRWIKGKL